MVADVDSRDRGEPHVAERARGCAENGFEAEIDDDAPSIVSHGISPCHGAAMDVPGRRVAAALFGTEPQAMRAGLLPDSRQQFRGVMIDDEEITMSEKSYYESFSAQTESVINKIKALIHEGNVRRVIIQHQGRTVAEFPLTAGVVGAVLAPVLAAIGALVALLQDCTIQVERERPASEPEQRQAGVR